MHCKIILFLFLYFSNKAVKNALINLFTVNQFTHIFNIWSDVTFFKVFIGK